MQRRLDNVEDWCASCPLCQGSMFLSATSSERCPCWRLFMSTNRLIACGFPRAYTLFNWDSMWPTKLQTSKEWEAQFPDSYAWEFDQETTDEEAIRYWVDNPDQVQTRGLSLLLFSGKGVGKTSLATTLAKEYTKRVGVDDSGAIGSFTPRFIVTDTLYELILTRSWHGLELYQKAISSDLLVLDDLRLSFKGMGANDYFERLHSCLQHRAANNLPTIITVNKIDDRKDFQANCVTDFLGVQAAELPDKFGKYRFVRLSNTALRPEPEWGI